MIAWGAESVARTFLSQRLGAGQHVCAGDPPGRPTEELATSVTASLRDSPWIALGDVMGANIAICLVALGVGALIAPLPFGPTIASTHTSAFRWA